MSLKGREKKADKQETLGHETKHGGGFSKFSFNFIYPDLELKKPTI